MKSVFLPLVFLAFAASCFGNNLRQNDRPNIVFIICDDLNDAIGVYGGHPQTLTPHIDRLAKSGVKFENAQANVPLCGPSRISLVTGFLPTTTGYYGHNFLEDHWSNYNSIATAVTFMEHLRNNGYKTYGTGKIYHNHQNKISVWDEYGHLASWGPWPYDGSSDDKYEHEELAPWGNASIHPSKPDLGFDSLFSRLSAIPRIAKDPEKGIPGYDGWRLYFRPFHYKTEEDRDLMPDELNAQWAIKKLQEEHDSPFLLCVGINRPHSPMIAPDEYFDRIPIDELELAKNIPGDLEDCADSNVPPSILVSPYGFEKYQRIKSLGYLKGWTQAYLANVAFVDDQIGKIMDALENSKYANNTYIIFTSDNGYHIGEKTYLHKNSLWEESCRIPLIAAGPGVKPGGTVSMPVSLVDLYPTFVDISELDPNPNANKNEIPLDGHSLLPLMENPGQEKWQGNDFALSAIRGLQELGSGEPGFAKNQHFSLRTARFRYIRLSDGQEELYDHSNDEYEWTNLVNDPEYKKVLAKLRSDLMRQIKNARQ